MVSPDGVLWLHIIIHINFAEFDVKQNKLGVV